MCMINFVKNLVFHLFSTDKFGYNVQRDVRLLRYSQKFAAESDYILFAWKIFPKCGFAIANQYYNVKGNSAVACR